MAIEAPASKYRKTNLKLYIAACLIFAIWFGYDGYFNKKFIEKHSPDGVPDGTLVFNQKSPPVFIAVAVLLGVYLFAVGRKKLVAEENELIFSDKDKIAYDSILKINKTNFQKKGYFVITYKDKNDREVDRKISDKKFGNLAAVLDHLVAKITGD
jgi:hypothetical protein